MEEETILESIFFDREQRVLANVSDEERNVILEIERDGKEDKIIELKDCPLIGNHNYQNVMCAVIVAKLEGILNENIIAFGDGLNDVDMLKKCGVGVAMKNALPEVKEQADYITSRTNNENGVVEFLKEYLVEI